MEFTVVVESEIDVEKYMSASQDCFKLLATPSTKPSLYNKVLEIAKYQVANSKDNLPRQNAWKQLISHVLRSMGLESAEYGDQVPTIKKILGDKIFSLLQDSKANNKLLTELAPIYSNLDNVCKGKACEDDTDIKPRQKRRRVILDDDAEDEEEDDDVIIDKSAVEEPVDIVGLMNLINTPDKFPSERNVVFERKIPAEARIYDCMELLKDPYLGRKERCYARAIRKCGGDELVLKQRLEHDPIYVINLCQDKLTKRRSEIEHELVVLKPQVSKQCLNQYIKSRNLIKNMDDEDVERMTKYDLEFLASENDDDEDAVPTYNKQVLADASKMEEIMIYMTKVCTYLNRHKIIKRVDATTIVGYVYDIPQYKEIQDRVITLAAIAKESLEDEVSQHATTGRERRHQEIVSGYMSLWNQWVPWYIKYVNMIYDQELQTAEQETVVRTYQETQDNKKMDKKLSQKNEVKLSVIADVISNRIQ